MLKITINLSLIVYSFSYKVFMNLLTKILHKYYIRNIVKMKMISKFKNFDSFILEESSTQRNSAISTTVSRIKEEFGDTKEKFLKSAEEKGVNDIKDFIVQTLKPYIDRIESQEKLQSNGRFLFDFDGLLSGLVSWMLVEMEIDRMKNKKE